jgi:hypothetical protein
VNSPGTAAQEEKPLVDILHLCRDASPRLLNDRRGMNTTRSILCHIHELHTRGVIVLRSARCSSPITIVPASPILLPLWRTGHSATIRRAEDNPQR